MAPHGCHHWVHCMRAAGLCGQRNPQQEEVGAWCCVPSCTTHSAYPARVCVQGGTENLVEIIALILLPVAILMCAYALVVFIWRAQQIEKKHVRGGGEGVIVRQHTQPVAQAGYIDDRKGPLTLAVVVVIAQIAIFVVSCVDFWEQLQGADSPAPAPAPSASLLFSGSASSA